MFLPYGTGQIEFPDLWRGRACVVEPGPFPVGVDGKLEVIRALENPVGSVRLGDLCRGLRKVAVVVPDHTRRAAVRVYLPPLLDELGRSGIRDEDVTVLVALGIHRPLAPTELARLVGKAVFDRYATVNHDPEGDGACVRVGTTSSGLPVEINRVVADADLAVLTGSIAYHYFAGYGGGRKSLVPGVASRSTCEANHRMVVDYRKGTLPGFLEPGVLDGNPVHEAMLEACAMGPPVFILNTVTEPGGGVVAAAAGALVDAHLEACRLHDLYYRRTLGKRSRLVISSAGGDPKDINFVQAHKGLYSAHRAATHDGVVILAARCTEGAGNPDFLKWFRKCGSPGEWLEELERNYQINGQTAFSTWLRVTEVPTVLISDLSPGTVEVMGMIPAGTAGEALDMAREVLGDLPAPVVLPDAGDTLVEIKGNR